MDIRQLTQVRKIRGLVSDDNELTATYELMIILCNLLFKYADDELLEMIQDVLKTELCSE